MNNRSSDGREVQGGRQAASAQERTQCECPKKFSEKWKTSQVYKLVIYRWNAYTSTSSSCAKFLASGREGEPSLRPWLWHSFALWRRTANSSRLFWSIFQRFFFRVSPLGITLSVVQTKWPLYTEQAIRSASACLAACLGACFLLGPLMRSVKPGCPFQPFVLATQFAPRRRISCQFKSQTKCLSPTWLWVCVRVCELSNWKLTLAITNWTLIKCGPRYTSATPSGPGAMRKCNKKVNLIDILLSLWLLFEKLQETGNFFVWLCVCVCVS